MLYRKLLAVLSTLACAGSVYGQASGPSYRELPSRPGVKQKLIYQRPADPVASAILLQGGPGAIGAAGSEDRGWIRYDGAFLSGGASRFTENGISAAVLDTPSDRPNLNSGFRSSAEHSEDIAAVIEFLRKQLPGKPVCLVGTSNGSLSAASGAALLGEKGPDCIVLTSAVSIKPTNTLVQRFAHVFTDADLTRIRVPVLIVHHRHDSCIHTPYGPMPGYVNAFPSAPRVDFITIEGGQDHSDSCNRGHHQYLGIEREVTSQIANWIKGLGR